jgi:hypothetical protein
MNEVPSPNGFLKRRLKFDKYFHVNYANYKIYIYRWYEHEVNQHVIIFSIIAIYYKL